MRWRYTEEGRKKLSKARRGKPRKWRASTETRTKLSVALKGKPKSLAHRLALSKACLGRPMPCGGGNFKGHRHTESAKKKVALSRLGIRRTDEVKRKVSLGIIRAIREGRIHIHNTRRERYRDISFRSMWEVLFAKTLDHFKILWKYEELLLISSGGYLVDFYLPEYGFYIEIKGYWRDDALRKFLEASRIYPIILLMEKELKELGIFDETITISKDEFIDRLGGELVRNGKKEAALCA